MKYICSLLLLLSTYANAANDIGYDFTFWMDNFTISYASIECGEVPENYVAQYKVVLPQPIEEPINLIDIRSIIPANKELYCWGFFSIADPKTGGHMGGPYYAGRVVKIWHDGGKSPPKPPIIIN